MNMNHVNLRIIAINHNGSSLKITAVPDDPSLYYWRQNANMLNSASINELSKTSPTQFICAELPVINWMNDRNNKNGQLIFAMAPSEFGIWKGAIGFQEKYGKEEYLFDVNGAAHYGTALNIIGSNSPYLIDSQNYLIVQIVTGELESISMDELLSGRNLAWLGNEIIQFQNAQLIGDKIYKLTNFVRGLFGTEYYLDKHRRNEDFICLDERLAAINIENNEINAYKKIKINSFGLMENQAKELDLSIQNYGLLAYNITNLKITKQIDGSYLLAWLPRVRFDGEWLDGRDVIDPDKEEQYKIRIFDQLVTTNKREFLYVNNSGSNIVDLEIYRISSTITQVYGIKVRIDLNKELILEWEFTKYDNM